MKPADRASRGLEIIKREAANFISENAGSNSLITVVRADRAKHKDTVLVFVSIFPEDKIQTAMLFLERQREAFSNHLKEKARLHPLPRIDFLLDNREDI